MKPSFQLLGSILIVALIALVDQPTMEVPKVSRFHVMSERDELPMYLAFDGTNQRFKAQWVVDDSMAWRFGDRSSAQRAADQYGGWAVPVRGGL